MSSRQTLTLKSLILSLLFLSINHAVSALTIYGQTPLGVTLSSTAGQAGPTSTPTSPAYDKTELVPPTPPQPPTTAFGLEIQPLGSSVANLSILQSGAFLGFSIEMSVVNQVLGKNSSHIAVPLLNLLGNLQHRAGYVRIRCGGNTQEFARYRDSLDNYAAIAKERIDDVASRTQTPAVLYTMDLFNIMSNISSLVNVGWYLGIPFNESTNFDLRIAEYGQAVLGDHLLGLQAGNEPDLYARHGKRVETYTVQDYIGEIHSLVQAINSNPNIPVKNALIGPSVASADWSPEMVWETGYIETFKDSISILSVEHYPNNNCVAQFGGEGGVKVPQDEFHAYLNHNAGRDLVRPYLESSRLAREAGKPFMMFETNTASCGGFPGISDTFGAALWALDYGYQMAHANFSGALLHVGGQNVYYNPFTAPPTNQSAFHQWTVGAVFYSVLVMTESFGKSNESQILDLNANGDNIFTPAYVIYDRGQLSKVALFNYVNDPSGASDYTATISVGGGNTGAPNSTPALVRVKYLLAPSIQTGDNITWANQTFGNDFEVDGHLKGDLNIVEVPCDQAANTCQIKVPAPGFALVFINSDPETDASDITFSTTAFTKTINTASVDPVVLATSNGMSGKERQKLGSTSPGSVENGASTLVQGSLSAMMVFTSIMAGWLMLRHLAV